MRVSLPPTIRSSMEDPHFPGIGKSLARKTTPGSPELYVGCGGGVTGASLGQQTCNNKLKQAKKKNEDAFSLIDISHNIEIVDGFTHG